MLSARTQKRIIQLRQAGRRYREIASDLHVGRSTIARVIKRNGALKIKKIKPDKQGKNRLKSECIPILENVGRCPTCGRLIELPCRECDPRNRHSHPVIFERKADLKLDLTPEDYIRYCRLKDWIATQVKIRGPAANLAPYPDLDKPSLSEFLCSLQNLRDHPVGTGP